MEGRFNVLEGLKGAVDEGLERMEELEEAIEVNGDLLNARHSGFDFALSDLRSIAVDCRKMAATAKRLIAIAEATQDNPLQARAELQKIKRQAKRMQQATQQA